jgi:hypothetical protein
MVSMSAANVRRTMSAGLRQVDFASLDPPYCL